MRLATWLEDNEKTINWLAEKVGRDASVISKLKDGFIRPSNEVAAKIHTLTGGEVTSVDHEMAYAIRHAKPKRRSHAARASA